MTSQKYVSVIPRTGHIDASELGQRE